MVPAGEALGDSHTAGWVLPRPYRASDPVRANHLFILLGDSIGNVKIAHSIP